MGNQQSLAEQASQRGVAEAGVYRSSLFEQGNKIESYCPQVSTLHESFQLAVKRYPHKPCFGKQMGQFIDYNAAARRIEAFGSGLKKFTALSRGSVVGLLAGASLEATVAVQACSSFSWAVCPMFESFRAHVISGIIKDTDMSVIICSPLYTTFLLDLKMPTVKFIVQLSELLVGQREKAASLGVTLFSFQDVELCGADYPQPLEPPRPSDLCHITVSPCTTRDFPALTYVTHAQYLSQVSAVAVGFWMLVATAEESYFSFNSMAFYWERVLQETMFVTGSAIAFTSGGNVLNEMRRLKPTFLGVIPQFFGFVSARLSAELEGYSLATRMMFFQALEQKKSALAADGTSYTSMMYDRVFFNVVREILGGQLRIILSVGDWVDPLPLDFLRCCLCCPVVLAYGTSETGILTITHKNDVLPGSLGPPLPGVEIKLMEIPSLGLTGEFGEPGEISVRINQGPWILTGDVGRWTRKNTLEFLDRVAYTKQVEGARHLYLGRLSNMYSRNQWVNQIFVYREEESKKLAAVVVPDLLELTKYAQDLKTKFEGMWEGPTDPMSIVSHAGVKKMVLQSLENTCVELGLDEYHEKIEKFRFQIDPFSIENGFLGVTLKQRRNELERDFC